MKKTKCLLTMLLLPLAACTTVQEGPRTDSPRTSSGGTETTETVVVHNPNSVPAKIPAGSPYDSTSKPTPSPYDAQPAKTPSPYD